jgi:hypothetical protein
VNQPLETHGHWAVNIGLGAWWPSQVSDISDPFAQHQFPSLYASPTCYNSFLSLQISTQTRPRLLFSNSKSNVLRNWRAGEYIDWRSGESPKKKDFTWAICRRGISIREWQWGKWRRNTCKGDRWSLQGKKNNLTWFLCLWLQPLGEWLTLSNWCSTFVRALQEISGFCQHMLRPSFCEISNTIWLWGSRKVWRNPLILAYPLF